MLKPSPGPAAYIVVDDEPRGLAYTMGFLTSRRDRRENGQDPGKYDPIPAISDNGSYFYSRFKSSKNVKILKARRFNYKYEDTPSPATCKLTRM